MEKIVMILVTVLSLTAGVLSTNDEVLESFEVDDVLVGQIVDENQSTDDPSEAVRPVLDIVFVIDTTGSMSDEIREVKMHIKNIIEEIQEGEPKPDVSIGFVAYRDYEDEKHSYLFKKFFLTSDIDEAVLFLEELDAGGGGDYREAVTVGLDIAINEMNWRNLDDTGVSNDSNGFDENQTVVYKSGFYRRMIFLIGDAPPRTRVFVDGQNCTINPIDYHENVKDAQRMGIFIYTVSGSGMNSEGIRIWEYIANSTGAAYEKLVYQRVDAQEYVEDHDIDEKWVDEMKNSSDYDSSDGTVSTNQLGSFVKRNVQYQAECTGVKYD